MALMNLFSGQQWRNSYRDKPMDMVGGGGRRGDTWREYTEIYNTMGKTDRQWEFKQGLCNRLKGMEGSPGGRGHGYTYG